MDFPKLGTIFYSEGIYFFHTPACLFVQDTRMHFWQIWPNVLALYLFSRDDSEFYRTMKWTGIIFSVLLIYSASFGCIFFLTPLIPFVFFQPRLGRKLMDQMIWLWQLYAVVSLLRHVLPLRGRRSRSRDASDNTSMTMTNVLIW